VVTDDERLAVELAARAAYLQLGHPVPEDLADPQSFAELAAEEQLGLLLIGRLNDSPLLEPWTKAATPEATACFAELDESLGQVRDGQGNERLELLPACYHLLSDRELIPGSQVSYRARSLSDDDYWQQYFRGTLHALGIEPDDAPRLRLSRESLTAINREKSQVLRDFQTRLRLEAACPAPLSVAAEPSPAIAD
jgi:hypothetical protein